MKKARRGYLVGIILLIGLWFAVYIVNETPFLYRESERYTLPENTSLQSPDAAPLSHTDPSRETLVLLYHGYKKTPHNFKKIAGILAEKYDVIVPLYPGHGTTEEDFKQTNFSQWYALAKDTYQENRKQYRQVYVGGLSMGGTIALRLGEEFNSGLAPDGIISLAAPVFFNDIIGHGILYDWRLYFSRFAAWFLSELKETMELVDEDGAEGPGYEGKNYPPQAHSVKLAMHSTKRDLYKIKSPLLLMHSKGDKTVPFENLNYIAGKVSSGFIRMRVFDLRHWQHNRHMLTLYHSTRDEVLSEIEGFIERTTLLSGE